MTDLVRLEATLIEFPPSTNRLYIRTRHGTILSKEARKFKADALIQLMKEWMFSSKLEKDRAYRLTLRFYFPKIETSGWPKRAKNRFVKRDVSNLIKVLEDVIAQATGVDDSNTMEVLVYKRVDESNPRIEITFNELPEEEWKQV